MQLLRFFAPPPPNHRQMQQASNSEGANARPNHLANPRPSTATPRTLRLALFGRGPPVPLAAANCYGVWPERWNLDMICLSATEVPVRVLPLSSPPREHDNYCFTIALHDLVHGYYYLTNNLPPAINTMQSIPAAETQAQAQEAQ